MVKNLKYIYDPDRPELVVYDGDKPMGGFIGEMAEKQFAKLLETDAHIEISNMYSKEKQRKQLTQKLMAIWTSLGINNIRKDIIKPYGVISTTELSIEQLTGLINAFSVQYRDEPTASERKLRSQVMVLLTRYGVYESQDDWHKVNKFLMNPRIAGKLLFQMSETETQALIRKLHSMCDAQEKKKNEVKRQMMMN
jgi:hypothetical protein